ncbi:hypothetical protein GJW-30_1_04002 [Variibacter gotjawalensis]|uniref:Uncharacterized protein n=1 Tax=Variibacter gotjawalensis TaxID=1333996 RepID=A0A0S3PZT2_9BRAD|nr:hypothetical protein [Variibacter gotjawalensis]NIK47283.1 hypothetical protein [Variibacter gotjawalensis]RZS49183.1 hypothetical protein EV661_1609 [Variibacter gotjawalensis]BAT61445.1 hypothetical protein GJW-30_1_04002 [Variibacter gotjawalensis]
MASREETTRRVIVEIEVLRGIARSGKLDRVEALLGRALDKAYELLQPVDKPADRDKSADALSRRGNI